MSDHQPRWQRSSYCETGACLEVEIADDRVRLRRSNEADGPELVFTHREWVAFLSGVRAGDFDTP